MSSTTRLATGLLAVLTLSAPMVVGCSSDDEPQGADNDTATTDAAPDLSTYDGIDALHQQLVDQGVACGLEYNGLRDEGREVSICVIEGEQALLTIWDDPALVTEFADSEAAGAGDVAYGANWTVDVDSTAIAELVAGALDGTVSG